jgi:hypothetical protein
MKALEKNPDFEPEPSDAEMNMFKDRLVHKFPRLQRFLEVDGEEAAEAVEAAEEEDDKSNRARAKRVQELIRRRRGRQTDVDDTDAVASRLTTANIARDIARALTTTMVGLKRNSNASTTQQQSELGTGGDLVGEEYPVRFDVFLGALREAFDHTKMQEPRRWKDVSRTGTMRLVDALKAGFAQRLQADKKGSTLIKWWQAIFPGCSPDVRGPGSCAAAVQAIVQAALVIERRIVCQEAVAVAGV